MMRHCAIFMLLLGLCGCPYISLVTLYNNNNATVVFCDLHAYNNPCRSVPGHAIVREPYLGDPTSWDFRISSGATSRTYKVSREIKFWSLRSTHYCYFAEGCDVPLQLEPDGLLYWVGTEATMPVHTFPPQPPGFPLRSESL
jgi:hypothetical protein